MPEAGDPQASLRENLTDAGCGPKLAGQVMELLEAGRRQEGLALLTQYRRKVLSCCHREQRKLECLDYLIYITEKGDIV